MHSASLIRRTLTICRPWAMIHDFLARMAIDQDPTDFDIEVEGSGYRECYSRVRFLYDQCDNVTDGIQKAQVAVRTAEGDVLRLWLIDDGELAEGQCRIRKISR